MNTSTQTNYVPFVKVVRLGTVKINTGRPDPQCNVFCKIEFNDKGNLSITGVEGPFKNGDCAGGCGQIRDHITIDHFAPGWDANTLAKFVETWKQWHLNDMNAACEHQTGEGWEYKDVEIITYGLTTETWQEQKRLKAAAVDRLLNGETVTLDPAAIALIKLPWERTSAPNADGIESGAYEVKKRETKGTGWLTEKEHPEGFLSKPCPTCGHKYGSDWLRREVPTEVINQLKALPDTDRTPAWV